MQARPSRTLIMRSILHSAEATFDAADVNHDGVLSKHEFQEFLHKNEEELSLIQAWPRFPIP